LFLEGVQALPLPFEVTLQAVQFSLMLGMVIWTVFVTEKVFYHKILSLFMVAAIGLNPFYWQFGLKVLSEAPFFAFIMMMAACLFLAIAEKEDPKKLYTQKRLFWISLAAVAIGAATLIRPVGIAFAPVLLIPVLLEKKKIQTLLYAMIPILLILGASKILDPRQGEGSISKHGINSVFGQLIFHLPETLPGINAEQLAPLSKEVARYRQWVNHAPGYQGRAVARLMVWNSLNNKTTQILPETGLSKNDIVLALLEDRPEIWLYEIVQNFYTLCFVPVVETQSKIDHWVASREDVAAPISKEDIDLATIAIPGFLVFLKDIAFGVIMLVTLILPFIWVTQFLRGQRLSPLWSYLTALSLGIIGYYVTIAAFNGPLFRYQVAVYPLQVMIGTGFLLAIVTAVEKHLRRKNKE